MVITRKSNPRAFPFAMHRFNFSMCISGSHLHISDILRVQALHKLQYVIMFEIWIVSLNYQEEAITRGERKIRCVEYRMVRLRQLIKRQHPENSGKGRTQHRAFESNGKESRPTVIRLAADIEPITNHLRQFFYGERRIAIYASIAGCVGAMGGCDQVSRILKFCHHAIQHMGLGEPGCNEVSRGQRDRGICRQRPVTTCSSQLFLGESLVVVVSHPLKPRGRRHTVYPYSSTSASGNIVRISKMEIIGRKRMNKNTSDKKNPIVPMYMDQSHIDG